MRFTPRSLSTSSLITGAGPIGIRAGAVARHIRARHIVITDVNPKRLKLAIEVADVMPVDVTKEDLKEVMRRLRMTEGFDYSDIYLQIALDVRTTAGSAPPTSKCSADVQALNRARSGKTPNYAAPPHPSGLRRHCRLDRAKP
jgi:hypothetical protein